MDVPRASQSTGQAPPVGVKHTGAPVPTKLCPTCEGDAVRYLSGPSWGYWGGQDIEYTECPTCDGIGTIPDDEEDA